MGIGKKHLLGILLLIAFCNNTFSQKGLKNSIADSSSRKEFDGCILKIEYPATFFGGSKALEAVLNKKMVYPLEALKNNYSGKIVIQFVITKDGAIQESKILHGACLYYGLGEEALKLVSNMPKWQPGEQNGRRVTYRYFIDMMFSAENQIPFLAIKLNLKYNGQYGNPDSSCNKILFW